MQVDIAVPEVFIGGLLGAMLVFLFSAWACAAVGRSAQAVVNEVQPAGFPITNRCICSVKSRVMHRASCAFGLASGDCKDWRVEQKSG